MSRRLEVELTSKRDDGTYTWRAVGAKQPRGDLDGSLLYEGAQVGDVVRADADIGVDGVLIVSVLPPKTARVQPNMLEMLGGGRDEGAVTTELVGKRGRGGDRGDRGDRKSRGRDGGRDRDRGGRGKADGGSRGGGRGDRSRGGRNADESGNGGRSKTSRARRERPAPPPKPKAKRLRARRKYRDAVLADLPEVQRSLARVVMRDGVPGIRQAVEKQNELARKQGQPEIPPKILESVGEHLLPRLRSAEWRDNAEAALAGMVEIDLRDIRKVVVAAENGAKDDESRALAEQLKTGLSARVEAEHGKWLSELAQLLGEGRTVRALRQSSRPPKAGAPLPPDLAGKLTEAANAAMTADTMPERWGTVLDAVAFSPVRAQVQPQSPPSKVSDELRATVKKLSKRVPDIAKLFTVKPAATPKPAATTISVAAPGPEPVATSAASDSIATPEREATSEPAPTESETDEGSE